MSGEKHTYLLSTLCVHVHVDHVISCQWIVTTALLLQILCKLRVQLLNNFISDGIQISISFLCKVHSIWNRKIWYSSIFLFYLFFFFFFFLAFLVVVSFLLASFPFFLYFLSFLIFLSKLCMFLGAFTV